MVVYDIRPDATGPLLAMGAKRGISPADVMALCDVVVTMVYGPKEVAEVLRGPQGFLTIDCTGKIWIDMTTSSPVLMRELAAEFAARGGRCGGCAGDRLGRCGHSGRYADVCWRR